MVRVRTSITSALHHQGAFHPRLPMALDRAIEGIRARVIDLEPADRRAAGIGRDMNVEVVDHQVVGAVLGAENDRDSLAGLNSDLLRLESERPARHSDVASIVSHGTRNIMTTTGLTGGLADTRRHLALVVVSTTWNQAPAHNKGQDNHRTAHQDTKRQAVDMPQHSTTTLKQS